MQIKITLLDVGDADAIIVHLKRKTGEQLVALIDAGNVRDGQKCIDKLDPILKSAGKKAPDLIVCTHYDADHIGGLIKVIARYGNDIGNLWMHRPGIQQQAAMVSEILLMEERLSKLSQSRIKKFNDFKQWQVKEARLIVLESYKQLKRVDQLIRPFGGKVIAPFPGVQFAKWPEIKILGPSPQFYGACIAKIKDIPSLITETAGLLDRQQTDSLKRRFIFESLKAANSPCAILANRAKTSVSAVNQISLILQIDAGEEKYLFTGDASLESFRALPGYPGCISGMHWLKVPHHGSHNNCSPALFDQINPQFAAISGGEQYLDDDVLRCLKKRGTKVQTTRDSGTIYFP